MKNCLLCDGPLGSTLLTINEPDRFEAAVNITREGYERTWRKCARCGAAINVMASSDEAKLDALNEEYYEVDLGTGIEARYEKIMRLPPSESDNHQRVLRVLNFMEKWTNDGRALNVLDVGSGLGVFPARLLELAKPGQIASLLALEPDPIAFEHLNSLKKFSVQRRILDDTFDHGDFDLICLNKVMEHIRKPQNVISAIKDRLTDKGGVFYVEVPHQITIDRRPSTDNILGALHKHLYDVGSLSSFLANNGLIVLEAGFVKDPSGKLTCYAFASRSLDPWD